MSKTDVVTLVYSGITLIAFVAGVFVGRFFERERCAKIADEHAKATCSYQGSETAAMRLGAESIAAYIRR